MPQKIQITRQAKDKTEKSNRGTAVYFFYIELNQTPTQEWIQLFKNERARIVHNQIIPFEVNGKYIVIECTSEQLEAIYLPELRSNIQSINA